MQIFGHRINLKTKEIRPDLTKVEKLLNLPFPVNRSLLKGFIGGVNFWTEILSNIADPLAVLNSLLRNPGLPYQPEKEHYQAFEEIKKKLSADNFILLPDLNKVFYIFSDTGPTYSAGIIAQEGETGFLRPVIYFNKTLSETESRYSQVEREGVGLISLLKSYQYLLQLGKICLFTDCRALSFIKQGSNSNLKLNRYSQFLALFNYKVFFLAARHPISKLVDVMSRPDETRPKNMKFSEDIIEKIVIKPSLFWKYALLKGDLTELIQEGIKISQNDLDLTELETSKLQTIKGETDLVAKLSILAVTRAQTKLKLNRETVVMLKPDVLLPQDKPLSPVDLPVCEEKDERVVNDQSAPDWIDQHHYIQINRAITEDPHWKVVREKVQARDQQLSRIYRVKDGIIITKETPNRVVIPDSIAMELIHTVHVHRLYQHTGFKKIKQLLQNKFEINDLTRKITSIIRNCMHCVQNMPNTRKLRELGKVIPGFYPNHTVCVDLIVLDHASKAQCLQIVDQHSKFVRIIAIETDCTSEMYLQLLVDNWIVPYGIMRNLLSDNATILTSKLCNDLYLRFGINFIKIHPYKSRQNIVERFNRSLREQLRVLMHYHNIAPDQWRTMIGFVSLAINNCPQTGYEHSPAIRFLGRPTNRVIITSNPGQEKPIKRQIWNGAISSQLAKCYQAGANILVNTKTFNQGDIVYLKTRNIRVPFRKQFLSYRGPYVILDQGKSWFKIIEYRSRLFLGSAPKQPHPFKVDKDDVKHTECAHLFNKESYNSFVNTWRGRISKYHDLEDSEDEDEEE